MRYSAAEKHEIITLVEQPSLSLTRTLQQLGINKSTFYNWLGRFAEGGIDALPDLPSKPGLVWNKLPEHEQQAVIELALDKPRTIAT